MAKKFIKIHYTQDQLETELAYFNRWLYPRAMFDLCDLKHSDRVDGYSIKMIRAGAGVYELHFNGSSVRIYEQDGAPLYSGFWDDLHRLERLILECMFKRVEV